MSKDNIKKRYREIIVMCTVILVLVSVTFMTLNYPSKMKDMFVQSSLESMEKKLNDAAVYTNSNIEMNYEEIKLLSGLISDNMTEKGNITQNVLSIMEETKVNAGFSNIGIMRMDDSHLFATMSTGKKVQLDIWTISLPIKENKVSVELQTSPFNSVDEGKDAVVYRYIFKGKKGVSYMLIAEKTQETLNKVLNADASVNGFTMVMRENGNVVYDKGTIDSSEIDSYNIYAMLSELGADDKKTTDIKEKIDNNSRGRFSLIINGEPYYFIFNKIENTEWICVNAYSETAMSGENLSVVNRETIKLVFAIVGLLILVLVFSILLVRNSMKRLNEEEVLKTEKLFEEMSRYIPMAFAILKGNSGETSFISHNFYEILDENSFDFSLEGITGWAKIKVTEEATAEFEKEGKFQSTIFRRGRYFSLGVYYIGMIDKEKHYVLIFNDITDEMDAKKLLEDSISRADAASKSKTQFLSKMSHEIRTPLNSVIGFSGLALDGWDVLSNEELRDYVNKIQISGNYLLELVSDILDVSRIEEGRMQISKAPCSLDDMVNEVVASFQGQMEKKNHQFIVDKNYEDVVLNMDSYHTKQILNNLISNSCKYTEEGGCVGLEVNTHKIDEKQMSVQFIVQDTGIGMDAEFVEKIFEPFTQDERGMKMKKQLRGSGLGMSICKNLVDLQNGTIRVESELGEGSCFTVQLTYELAENGDEGRKDNVIEKEVDYNCLKGKKILVVDDVEMNRIFIEKLLSSYGLIYDEAEDGKQALDMFVKSKKDEYFAIFMDVNMPVMDGHKATEQIRKSDHPDAKTIVVAGMTADAFSDDVNKALMSGMNYHVSKPIQKERVLNVLMETYEKKAGK